MDTATSLPAPTADAVGGDLVQAGAPSPEPAAPAPRPSSTASGDHAHVRLWAFSDLRIDLRPVRPPEVLPSCDAIVVAGGIRPGLCEAIRWVAAELDGRQGDRPVVFVPGPAEYCDGRPVRDALAEAIPLARSLGIALLHDDAIRIGPQRGSGWFIIGATLWVDFAIEGASRVREARVHARGRWPLHARAFAEAGVPFRPHDAAGAHARSRAFIEDALTSLAVAAGLYGVPVDPIVPGIRGGDRAIVVTAYPPSQACLPPALARPILDPWRVAWHASALDGIMEARGAPDAWICGNLPNACDLRIGRTRVVANACNPRDPTGGFDPLRTILV